MHVCICVCSACFADITNHVTLSLLATCNLRRLLDVCKSNKPALREGSVSGGEEGNGAP